MIGIIEEELEEEFELWDALSDEALISFENKLQSLIKELLGMR